MRKFTLHKHAIAFIAFFTSAQLRGDSDVARVFLATRLDSSQNKSQLLRAPSMA